MITDFNRSSLLLSLALGTDLLEIPLVVNSRIMDMNLSLDISSAHGLQAKDLGLYFHVLCSCTLNQYLSNMVFTQL